MNIDLFKREIIRDAFICVGKIKDKELIENLKSEIKNFKIKEEDNLSYKTNVKGIFTGWQSLVKNKFFLEFLFSIKKEIKLIYDNNFIITDAWGNILKKDEEVIEHTHGNNAFSGIIYLTDGGPGTFFRDLNLTIEEEIGKYILFTPYLKHSVQKINKDIERITIAFNFNEISNWQDLTKIEWANKNEI
jgi:hypothetical protein